MYLYADDLSNLQEEGWESAVTVEQGAVRGDRWVVQKVPFLNARLLN